FIGNSGGGGGTFTGPNLANTWHINALNAGTLTFGAVTVSFSGFANLVGGSASDNFLFGVNGLVTTIDGKAGGNTLDFTAFNTPQTVILTGVSATVGYAGTSSLGFSAGGSFTNITAINSSTTAATNVLTGANRNTTWTINAANAGTLTDQATTQI